MLNLIVVTKTKGDSRLVYHGCRHVKSIGIIHSGHEYMTYPDAKFQVPYDSCQTLFGSEGSDWKRLKAVRV